jgi:hypothetical protein
MLSKCRILKAEAEAIAAKLKAIVDTSGAHPQADFYYDDKLIFSFGYRHSKKSPNGHLVGTHGPLMMNEAKALQFARCTYSYDDYIEHLKSLGVIDGV